MNKQLNLLQVNAFRSMWKSALLETKHNLRLESGILFDLCPMSAYRSLSSVLSGALETLQQSYDMKTIKSTQVSFQQFENNS